MRSDPRCMYHNHIIPRKTPTQPSHRYPITLSNHTKISPSQITVKHAFPRPRSFPYATPRHCIMPAVQQQQLRGDREQDGSARLLGGGDPPSNARDARTFTRWRNVSKASWGRGPQMIKVKAGKAEVWGLISLRCSA